MLMIGQVDFNQRISVSLKPALPFLERRRQRNFAKKNSLSFQALAFSLANVTRTPPFSIRFTDSALYVGEHEKGYRESSPPEIKIDFEQDAIEALANVATLFQVFAKITDKEYEILFFFLLTTRLGRISAELEEQGVMVELPETGLTPRLKQRFLSKMGQTFIRSYMARTTTQPILLAGLVKDLNLSVREKAAKNKNTHWRDVVQALIRLPQDVEIKRKTSPGGYDGLSFYPEESVEHKGKIGYAKDSLEKAREILSIHERYRPRILSSLNIFNPTLYKALTD